MPRAEAARAVLICHDSEPLNHIGLARWMASFMDLRGVIVIHEPKGRLWKRIRREVERIGPFRFLDVMAFRLYYRAFLAGRDQQLEEAMLRSLEQRYPALPA